MISTLVIPVLCEHEFLFSEIKACNCCMPWKLHTVWDGAALASRVPGIVYSCHLYSDPVSWHPCEQGYCHYFCNLTNLIRVQWYFTVVLTCIFLLANDVWRLFLHLFAIFMVSLVKILLTSCPFSNWLVLVSLDLKCKHSLHVWEPSSLTDIWFANAVFFFLMNYAFNVESKKHMLILRFWRFSPMTFK